MALQNIGRRLDLLEALTQDTGRSHYIWREMGETVEQAIERTGMQGRHVMVIGWNDDGEPR
jgi:hypothetical protein